MPGADLRAHPGALGMSGMIHWGHFHPHGPGSGPALSAVTWIPSVPEATGTEVS